MKLDRSGYALVLPLLTAVCAVAALDWAWLSGHEEERTMETNPANPLPRRQFLGKVVRLVTLTGLGLATGVLVTRSTSVGLMWQIDPG
jgi:hypothetical protein